MLSSAFLLISAFGNNAASSKPVWKSGARIICAAGLPSVIGSVFGVSVSRWAKLPWPSAVAVGVETSIQNKFVAIAVLSLTFKNNLEASDSAMVIPILYAAIAFLVNCIWCTIAWKRGYTFLDKNTTLRGFVQAFRDAQKQQKKKTDERFIPITKSKDLDAGDDVELTVRQGGEDLELISSTTRNSNDIGIDFS